MSMPERSESVGRRIAPEPYFGRDSSGFDMCGTMESVVLLLTQEGFREELMVCIERAILIGLPNPAVVHATPWCGMYHVAGAQLRCEALASLLVRNCAERGIRGKRGVSP